MSARALRGRDHEWRRIVGLLDRARAGERAVLLVEGRPGTGKTRLLQELVGAAERAGIPVLGGGDLFEPRPAGLPRIAGPVPRHLALPPHLPGGPAPPDWFAEELDVRLAEQSPAGPALLVLDDLQWADPEWMSLMCARPRYPLVCALARRTGTGGARLDWLFTLRDESTVRIDLGPLPETAVAQVVADLLGAAPQSDLLALVARAAGNPLLIVELVHGLREEERLEFDASAVRLRSAQLPRRVETVIEHQLFGLSAKARHVLQVASVFGMSFALPDVAEMLRETAATLLPALEEALVAGVLACDARRLRFSHELVWHVVKESLPELVRGELDREAGRMLVARGDDGFVSFGGPDSWSCPSSSDHADRARLSEVVTAVDSHLASGHLASAAALAQDALSRPVPARHAAELQCRLAHILIMGGRADLATVAAEGPLAGAGLPVHVRENAEAARIVALSLRDGEQAGRVARAVLGDRDRRAGDPAVVTAATVLSNLLWDAGDLTESLRLARDSVAGIRAGTPASWRTNARLALARKLSSRREFADAEQLIRRAEADSDQHGLTVHSAAPAVARARLLSQAGRLAEARAEAVAALSSARELGAQLLTPLATSVLAFVSLRSGDLLAAADYVRRYRADLGTGISPMWSVQYDWLELLLTAEQDGPRRAADLLDGPHAGLPARPALFAEEPGAAAWLVRLALAIDAPELAEVAVATAERLAASNPGFAAVAVGAVHARGLVDRDVAALGQAAEEHRDPWARALAAEDRAVHLAGRRRGGTAAVSALELALQVFEEIGAQHDCARIRGRLRALGVRRRPMAGSRCGTSGWVSLSDPERTISHLVNQGLTNRQIAKRVFLSPHTVNYHLRQIFRKLGITSRVELARMTQEQHLATGGTQPSPPGCAGPGPAAGGQSAAGDPAADRAAAAGDPAID